MKRGPLAYITARECMHAVVWVIGKPDVHWTYNFVISTVPMFYSVNPVYGLTRYPICRTPEVIRWTTVPPISWQSWWVTILRNSTTHGWAEVKSFCDLSLKQLVIGTPSVNCNYWFYCSCHSYYAWHLLEICGHLMSVSLSCLPSLQGHNIAVITKPPICIWKMLKKCPKKRLIIQLFANILHTILLNYCYYY